MNDNNEKNMNRLCSFIEIITKTVKNDANN